MRACKNVHVELHVMLVICALLIAFTAPQGDLQVSPLTGLIWFCQMCSVSPLRPRQPLISPLLLFITFESGDKRRRMWGTNMRIKGGRVGHMSGLNLVYRSGLSKRDGFIIPGISACDCKSGVTFSVSLIPSHSFSITWFHLSSSPAAACSAKSLGSWWLEYQWISLY